MDEEREMLIRILRKNNVCLVIHPLGDYIRVFIPSDRNIKAYETLAPGEIYLTDKDNGCVLHIEEIELICREMYFKVIKFYDNQNIEHTITVNTHIEFNDTLYLSFNRPFSRKLSYALQLLQKTRMLKIFCKQPVIFLIKIEDEEICFYSINTKNGKKIIPFFTDSECLKNFTKSKRGAQVKGYYPVCFTVEKVILNKVKPNTQLIGNPVVKELSNKEQNYKFTSTTFFDENIITLVKRDY